MATSRSVFHVGKFKGKYSWSLHTTGYSQPSLTSQGISASAPVIVALGVLHPEWTALETISVPGIHLPHHVLCLPEAWLTADGPAQLHNILRSHFLNTALRGMLG